MLVGTEVGRLCSGLGRRDSLARVPKACKVICRDTSNQPHLLPHSWFFTPLGLGHLSIYTSSVRFLSLSDSFFPLKTGLGVHSDSVWCLGACCKGRTCHLRPLGRTQYSDISGLYIQPDVQQPQTQGRGLGSGLWSLRQAEILKTCPLFHSLVCLNGLFSCCSYWRLYIWF